MNAVGSLFKQPRWSPYVVGIGIGVLSWAAFGLMGKALGTSTTMVQVAGMAEAAVTDGHVYANEYFQKYLGTAEAVKPAVEWQFALVLLLPIGAYLAAKLGGSQLREHVPALWAQRFGESRAKRYVAAFVGGAVLLFGARMAGGCTSGHGISGGLQLAISSWTFMIAMFASGIITAMAMFGRKGHHHA